MPRISRCRRQCEINKMQILCNLREIIYANLSWKLTCIRRTRTHYDFLIAKSLGVQVKDIKKFVHFFYVHPFFFFILVGSRQRFTDFDRFIISSSSRRHWWNVRLKSSYISFTMQSKSALFYRVIRLAFCNKFLSFVPRENKYSESVFSFINYSNFK